MAEPHTYDTIVGKRKGFVEVRACCCLALQLQSQPPRLYSLAMSETKRLEHAACHAAALVLRLLGHVCAPRPSQVALETGASIVPCLAFGETNTFNTHVPPEVSRTHT